MNLKLIISLFTFALLFSSCYDEAHIKVTNKVHNVTLENVSYASNSLTHRLYPGESSSKVRLSDDDDRVSFPMSAQIEFYMVKGDKRVFLKTKESYILKKNQTLEVTITDETEVVNPMTESIR